MISAAVRNTILEKSEQLFITTWEVAANDTITFPMLSSTHIHAGTIDWGDGTGTVAYSGNTDPALTHTYLVAGTYQVGIGGICESLVPWRVDAWPPQCKGVDNMGYVGWKYLAYGFSYSEIRHFRSRESDLSGILNINQMFMLCRKLAEIDTSIFDTSGISDFSAVFENCNILESVDVSGWDTQNASAFIYTFFECRKIQTLDLSNWVAPQCTRFRQMFFGCNLLSDLDFSSLTFDNAVELRQMFSSCNSIEVIDFSGVQMVSATSLINMNGMFTQCNKLQALDLSGFLTESITDMSFLFDSCHDLASLDISNFNFSNVTNISYMFRGCYDLTTLDISAWDTANVVNMNSTFNAMSAVTTLDFSSWSFASVNNMAYFLYSTSIMIDDMNALLMQLSNTHTELNVTCDLGSNMYSASSQQYVDDLESDGWIITSGGIGGYAANIITSNAGGLEIVPNVNVELFPGTDDSEPALVDRDTDANGEVTIMLPAGDYFYIATDTGYYAEGTFTIVDRERDINIENQI